MEADKKKKSEFSAISINRITAERFRLFSKKFIGSHSDTLDDMMDFFEGARISPRNKVMMYRFNLFQHLDSRFDFIEKLLRDQERNYHKPLLDMLTSLFEGVEALEQQKPLLLEKKLIEERKNVTEIKRNTFSDKSYALLQESQKHDRRNILNVLDKIERVEPTFGKAFFRINIDEGELALLKRKLRD